MRFLSGVGLNGNDILPGVNAGVSSVESRPV
jgi:hypothetical protein